MSAPVCHLSGILVLSLESVIVEIGIVISSVRVTVRESMVRKVLLLPPLLAVLVVVRVVSVLLGGLVVSEELDRLFGGTIATLICAVFLRDRCRFDRAWLVK